jgi:four helix bundle protein
LIKEKREFILSKQFLRSATSVGANVREATGAQSKADFIAKLSIAHKEALESEYWINLLKDSAILDNQTTVTLLDENLVIIKIITKSLLTAKQNKDKQ